MTGDHVRRLRARAGVPAINFGPGDPPQAHTRGEEISVAALVRSYRVLEAFAATL